jgi:hypothetical protein
MHGGDTTSTTYGVKLADISGIKCSNTFFFWLERPNLFAICNNTVSKWWEG